MRELGVSVYTPDEALGALREPDVRHVQVPLNILDRRWARSGISEVLRDRPDVTVYARSVFLQGALLLPPEKWPKPTLSHSHGYCRQLDQFVLDFGRQSRADLAIAYVMAQPWVDSVVLGVESMGQLEANLALMKRPSLTPTQVGSIDAAFADVPETVLNPATWNG